MRKPIIALGILAAVWLALTAAGAPAPFASPVIPPMPVAQRRAPDAPPASAPTAQPTVAPPAVPPPPAPFISPLASPSTSTHARIDPQAEARFWRIQE